MLQKLLSDIRARGLTQVEVAQLAGLNQSQISRIESGRIKDVRSSSFVKLQELHTRLTKRARRVRG